MIKKEMKEKLVQNSKNVGNKMKLSIGYFEKRILLMKQFKSSFHLLVTGVTLSITYDVDIDNM